MKSFLKKLFKIGDKDNIKLIDEYLLQYTSSGNEGEGEIVIGLDFGTSATKVVIQTPYISGGRAFAVDFGNELAHESMKYLIPNKLWIDSKGLCSIKKVDNSLEVNDIKLELFSKSQMMSNRGPTSQDISVEEAAVAYLALVLKYVRKWFLLNHRSLLEHFENLIWSVNMGVPSPCIEENEENKRFRRVGKAAWMLSVIGKEVSLKNAKKEIDFIKNNKEYWENDPDNLTCDFEIIPEIAAGAVGYALSDLRRNGVHLMIDIGASTVDVCSFLLTSDIGNRYNLLVSDVKQLGTIRLHTERIFAIKNKFELRAQSLRDKHDPLTPISTDLEQYLFTKDEMIQAIEKQEEELVKKCNIMLRRIIVDLKTKRARNENIWQTELPVILIGGGSKLQFFRSIVEELHPWLQSTYKNNGINLLPITVPKLFNNDDLDEYHRLAVAWGLSNPTLDIGEIIPADKIDDMEGPSQKNYDHRFISKDQV